MSYDVRINKQIISIKTLKELKERTARWKRYGLTIEVAEGGSQNFLPLNDFFPSSIELSSNVVQQSVISKGNHFDVTEVHPNMFHQSSSKKNQTSRSKQAPVPKQKEDLPSPPTTLQTSGWYVDKDAHNRLRDFIQKVHYGHMGPWLVSGNYLIPLAGFWITGAARIIDTFLFLITLGIYGLFMAWNISKGRQSVGQRFAGIRIVRNIDITRSPNCGRSIGLFFLMLVVNVPGILVQSFTKRKQGLHHMICDVMHIEDRHYGALRGAVPYIIACIIFIVLAVAYFYIMHADQIAGYKK